MDAVDIQNSPAVYPVQRRAFVQRDRMDGVTADIGIGVAAAAGALGRNILIQCTAQCHINELHPPANSEKGFSLTDGFAD